jgi:hypothetical protein
MGCYFAVSVKKGHKCLFKGTEKNAELQSNLVKKPAFRAEKRVFSQA